MEEKEINAIINYDEGVDNSELVEDFFDLDDFHNLDIWQEGVDLAVEAHQLIQLLPPEEGLFLSDQLCSAAIAIPTAIAQGKARCNDKDFQKFLLSAYDSTIEIETYLSICNGLEFLSEEQTDDLCNSCQQLREAIQSFIEKLKLGKENKSDDTDRKSSGKTFGKKSFDKKSFDKKPFRKRSFDDFSSDAPTSDDNFSFKKKSFGNGSSSFRSSYSPNKKSFKNNFTKKNTSWNDKKSTRKK